MDGEVEEGRRKRKNGGGGVDTGEIMCCSVCIRMTEFRVDIQCEGFNVKGSV
jgi:hypothetical protein